MHVYILGADMGVKVIPLSGNEAQQRADRLPFLLEIQAKMAHSQW